MKYGLPYQGSKSRIAPWVVEQLPASHTLVDLMAGGCAVTHAALLSDKWQRIIANDKTDAPTVFRDAIAGEYNGFATCPTREEFFASDDAAIRLLYSFGNDKTTYLWSPTLEAVKIPASEMLSAPSLHERRMAYKRFVRALVEYLRGADLDDEARKMDAGGVGGLKGLQGLLSLERLQGLERLERLERLEGIETSRLDYRLVDIPDGATVYCDPPYRATTNSKRYGAFDFEAFGAWLNGVDFPVYVSEFDAPDGCVEIASTERVTTMAAAETQTRVERLFVQERFA